MSYKGLTESPTHTCRKGLTLESSRVVNDALVRCFLRDFTPAHLHEIVHAMNAAQAESEVVEDLAGVEALTRFVYGQAVDWGDPLYEALAPYLLDEIVS